MKPKITLLKWDITEIPVDVIVNAANKTLLGGGGVDGAIHRKAGQELVQECQEIKKKSFPQGLPSGSVVATKAYNLPAKLVFHTVGPIYGKEDLSLLELCYLNCLKLAEEKKMQTISFPAISTGAYGVPINISVEIVNKVLKDFSSESIKEIKLILFKEEDLKVYKERLLF